MKFVFAGNLLRFVGYSKEVEIQGNTLNQCLEQVTQKFPDLRAVLFDREGRIRQTHQLFLNGEQLASPSGRDNPALLERTMQASDTLCILTAIAGG
jgi:sulfur-carrier protein